jgi:tetratricopeptide (TPR) repeat protein
MIRALPVPFKKEYLDSEIHVSVVSIMDETQLLVSGRRRYAPKRAGPVVLTQTAPVKCLSDLVDVLRTAAFMILELHGCFETRNGCGMRYLADGLDALDEYRRTPESPLMTKAKDCFARAVMADPNNYEAHYYYGSMLLMERKRESIATAITVFQRATKTGSDNLQALVNVGLATCYGQQYHRLAKRGAETLKCARRHAGIALKCWRKTVKQPTPRRKPRRKPRREPCLEPHGKPQTQELHPLILNVYALAKTWDEGVGSTYPDMERRFCRAADYLVRAIKLQGNNGMFCNSLGWIFLKLAERRVREVRSANGLRQLSAVDYAGKAREYLERALELNPGNKLSHANLCLVYALPKYHTGKERESNLDRCRYHGKKAVELDREYANGYRDLAVSMLRYGEIDEAYGYFESALRHARVIEKDREIIDDVTKVVDNETAIPEEEKKRWHHPRRELLVPGAMKRADYPQA